MLNIYDNLWDKLFNEKNAVETGTSMLWGYYVVASIVPPSAKLVVIFSWEILVKTGGGIAIALITAFLLNISKDVYELKIKPKIFKPTKRKVKKEEIIDY